MRGREEEQGEMLLSITPDALVPRDHPIRRVRAITDRALKEISPALNTMYASIGRPSVAPERLLKASILMALYSIRSERQFCERLQYDLLFKWFLNMNIAAPAFDHASFSKNRERLIKHEVAEQFFAAVMDEATKAKLTSDDHFTVDGTLLQAWASLKSVKPRDDEEPPASGGRNADVDFHGQRRTNETHRSTTDPEARIARKGRGQEAKLCFSGHVLMENRNGLVLDVLVSQANGTAERDAALLMLDRRRGPRKRVTLGADKGYDTRAFVEALRERAVTPHVAQHTTRRRSAIDGRTTQHEGYRLSQRVRKRVEEVFGWMKTVGGGRKLRYIGTARNQFWATLTATAYNLLRMANLSPATA
ncbi:MAG: IS5 family transposase [Myxococcales bacterium]|nr:IS5 family transposase [Myxococcales bacterium]